MDRHDALTLVARSAGSTAATERGILRAAMAAMRIEPPIDARHLADHRRSRAIDARRTYMDARAARPDLDARIAARAERLRHPAAYRARAMGGAVRGGYLRSLRAEWRRLTLPPSTLDGVRAFAQRWRETAARLTEIAADEAIVTGAPPREIPTLRQCAQAVRADYLPAGEDEIRAASDKRLPKFRGADGITVRRSFSAVGVEVEHSSGETEWKNGTPRAYTRASMTWTATCFAVIGADGTLAIRIADRDLSIQPPDGWRWDLDASGFRLVAADDQDCDFHISASHLLDWDATYICATARANAEKRRAQRLAAEADAADHAAMQEAIERGDLWLTVADSVRGGNCEIGTASWVNRHFRAERDTGSRAIPARVALRIADQKSRIMVAVRHAWMRAKRDNERGYGVIGEIA